MGIGNVQRLPDQPEQLSNDMAACSKAIFSHESVQDWSYRDDSKYLLVYPKFTELKDGSHLTEDFPPLIVPPAWDRKARDRRAFRFWCIRQDSMKGIPPLTKDIQTKVQPDRGIIKTFSRKAGTRMKKRMLAFVHSPEFWIDLTYPDDVMEGLSIEEQRDYDNKCFKRFKRKIEAKYLNIEGICRREWQKRKSGARKGIDTPHRHNLMRIPGLNESQKYKAIVWMLNKWVKCTGTKEIKKALKVTLNRKSYRLIQSAKMAQIYVSKYVSKFEDHKEDISRGRFWMKIGKPLISKPVAIPLMKNEDLIWSRKNGHPVKRPLPR